MKVDSHLSPVSIRLVLQNFPGLFVAMRVLTLWIYKQMYSMFGLHKVMTVLP